MRKTFDINYVSKYEFLKRITYNILKMYNAISDSLENNKIMNCIGLSIILNQLSCIF